jgi:hypothetical protein
LVPVGGQRIKIETVGGWTYWNYYVFMYENGKMRHVETILGIGMEDKEEWWSGWQFFWQGKVFSEHQKSPKFANNISL